MKFTGIQLNNFFEYLSGSPSDCHSMTLAPSIALETNRGKVFLSHKIHSNRIDRCKRLATALKQTIASRKSLLCQYSFDMFKYHQ